MKTYSNFSEDVSSRRDQISSRERSRGDDFTRQSKSDMDSGRGSVSRRKIEGHKGDTAAKKIGRAFSRDVDRLGHAIASAPGKAVRGALERRKKARAEKEAAAKSQAKADKKNEVKREPFKPKKASKGVPYTPKK